MFFALFTHHSIGFCMYHLFSSWLKLHVECGVESIEKDMLTNGA